MGIILGVIACVLFLVFWLGVKQGEMNVKNFYKGSLDSLNNRAAKIQRDNSFINLRYSDLVKEKNQLQKEHDKLAEKLYKANQELRAKEVELTRYRGKKKQTTNIEVV